MHNIITRLHPQGKGGPQDILCERRLNLGQKSEKIHTKWIPKSLFFERASIYQSGTFDPKKCVFDSSLAARRRYVFAKLTDPLISTDRGCLDYATQKLCHTGAAAQWQNAGKSVRRRRRRRTYSRTHVFKRRPHKMPFGQLYMFWLDPSTWSLAHIWWF